MFAGLRIRRSGFVFAGLGQHLDVLACIYRFGQEPFKCKHSFGGEGNIGRNSWAQGMGAGARR